MPMNTVRLVPTQPTRGGLSTVTANVYGRQISCAVGSAIDVSEGDAGALEGQGFVRVATSGPTASRPAYPATASTDSRIVGQPIGVQFLDLSLGKIICYVGGGVWIDPTSGAAV